MQMDIKDLFVKKGNRLDLVASVKVPHFVTRPEVIIWGIRVFVWSEPDYNYVEVMAVSVLDSFQHHA